MASTREINTPADYCLQQRGINQQYSHASYKYGWIPERSAFPCLGINMPMMTNGYNNGVLSGNPCAIESALFGIGSTNLANPKAAVTPQLHQMPQVKFFNTLKAYLPEPLVIEKSQRPIGPYS